MNISSKIKTKLSSLYLFLFVVSVIAGNITVYYDLKNLNVIVEFFRYVFIFLFYFNSLKISNKYITCFLLLSLFSSVALYDRVTTNTLILELLRRCCLFLFVVSTVDWQIARRKINLTPVVLATMFSIFLVFLFYYMNPDFFRINILSLLLMLIIVFFMLFSLSVSIFKIILMNQKWSLYLFLGLSAYIISDAIYASKNVLRAQEIVTLSLNSVLYATGVFLIVKSVIAKEREFN